MANLVVTVPQDASNVAIDEAKVYTRKSWSDLWGLSPYLFVNWASWSLGAKLDQAEIQWKYGHGAQFTQDTPTDHAKIQDFLGWYVKIEFGSGANKRVWVGRVQVDHDSQAGSSDTVVPNGSGMQIFHCYGMKYALYQHRIDDSWAEIEQFSGGASGERVGRGITFNRGKTSNRSLTKDGGSYIFGDGITSYWSTVDIIEYLLETQTPENENGDVVVPWELDAGSRKYLPDWDQPEVFQQRRNTLDLIDNLIARERLLCWWTDYDEANETIKLKISSFAEMDVTTGVGTIPANDTQHSLDLRRDNAAANVMLYESELDNYDQVIVYGARRTSTFTLNANRDFTLKASWDIFDKNLYDAGASNWPEYTALPPTNIEEKQRLNNIARANPSVRNVYAYFEWDATRNNFNVGDGIGSFLSPAFQPAGTGVYLHDLSLLTSLPLQENRDYSGSNIADGTFEPHAFGVQTKLRPLGYALPPTKNPAIDTIYIPIDQIGRSSNFPFLKDFEELELSCSLRVRPESKAIEVRVTGGQTGQHVISGTEFVGLPEDRHVPAWDWKDWIFTIAVEDDRYCQGVWPQEVPGVVDEVRKLIIDAGPSYRKDYVAPGTVVGQDGQTGKLLRSDGGYVQDDELELGSVAAAAFEWYGQKRSAISFDTVYRSPLDTLQLGDLITQFNGETLISVVSEIRVIHSEEEADIPNPAFISVQASFAEMDASAFVGMMLGGS